MTELDRLRRLLELVRAMRHARREYLNACANVGTLAAADKRDAWYVAEAEVDVLIRELSDPDRQGKLF